MPPSPRVAVFRKNSSGESGFSATESGGRILIADVARLTLSLAILPVIFVAREGAPEAATLESMKKAAGRLARRPLAWSAAGGLPQARETFDSLFRSCAPERNSPTSVLNHETSDHLLSLAHTLNWVHPESAMIRGCNQGLV